MNAYISEKELEVIKNALAILYSQEFASEKYFEKLGFHIKDIRNAFARLVMDECAINTVNGIVGTNKAKSYYNNKYYVNMYDFQNTMKEKERIENKKKELEMEKLSLEIRKLKRDRWMYWIGIVVSTTISIIAICR